MVAFSQLLALVVLLLVVLFAAGPPSNIIVKTAQNTAKIFGLEIGPPSIASFTATKSNNDGVHFKLAIGGNKENYVLEIYKAAASEDRNKQPPATPATVLKAPDAVIHDLAHLVYTSDTDKPEAIPDIVCPGDDECCRKKMVQPNCIEEKLAPDWYKFSACLKKKGSNTCVDQQEATLGLYTEDYVEFLNLPIDGCKDSAFDGSTFGNCNVIECKKKLINKDLNDPQQIASGIRKALVAEISQEFNARRPGCGDYRDNGNELTFVLNLDDCDDKEVDELNNKFARVRLLDTAFSQTGQAVNSEIKYKDRLPAEISLWAEQAVKMTMSCTESLDWLPGKAPKGAYKMLDSLGWFKSGNFIKKNSIIANNLPPQITSLQAQVLDTGAILLLWNKLLGENLAKAGSYQIVHSVTKSPWDTPQSPDSQEVLIPTEVILGQDNDGDATSSFETQAGQAAGKHKFEVNLFKEPGARGSLLSSAIVTAGVFDDSYIETQKGEIDNCVTKDSDSISKKCNVYEQKRIEMETPKIGGREKESEVRTALSRTQITTQRCEYDSVSLFNLGLTEQCTPDEVDRVWKNYLVEDHGTSVGPTEEYNCKIPINTESEAMNVCIAKRQTVNTLLANGWKDMRVNKRWEANI